MASGYAAKRIVYQKEGERVDPPVWWPHHVNFEKIADFMLAEDIREAYEAGRQYFQMGVSKSMYTFW